MIHVGFASSTSFSYASLDVLLKQLATLFTYIHNTIYAR